MPSTNNVSQAAASPVKLAGSPQGQEATAAVTGAQVLVAISLIKQLWKFLNSAEGETLVRYIADVKNGAFKQRVHDLGLRLVRIAGVNHAE